MGLAGAKSDARGQQCFWTGPVYQQDVRHTTTIDKERNYDPRLTSSVEISAAKSFYFMKLLFFLKLPFVRCTVFGQPA